MPRKSKEQKNREALIAAMTPLALHPDFEKFIELVRQMKDYTVQSMVHSDTLKSERESLAHKGEIRAYLWIIETYEAQRAQLEAQAQATIEHIEGQQAG